MEVQSSIQLAYFCFFGCLIVRCIIIMKDSNPFLFLENLSRCCIAGTSALIVRGFRVIDSFSSFKNFPGTLPVVEKYKP